MDDWKLHQRKAGRLAGEAERAGKKGDPDQAKALYSKAANEMSLSMITVPRNPNFLGSTVLTMVELYGKAGDTQKVEEIACRWIPSPNVSDRDRDKLRAVLSAQWGIEIVKVERVSIPSEEEPSVGLTR